MKLKKILLVCSLFLAGGGLATSNEEISRVNAEDGTENTYVKVTEALTDYSGEYLIVYEAGKKIFDGSLTTLDTNMNCQSVTITNNQITTNSAYSFTIASETSGYSIKSNSGYYIGATASNDNTLLSSKTVVYSNTIAINNSSFDIKSSCGTYLRYNDSGSRFRYYKSSSYTKQKAISLYKLEDNSVRYTTNFYLNDGTDTIYSTKSTKENESVSFPANPTRDGFEFLGWYDSQEGGNKVESLIATDNINLYAQWQEAYSISFDATPFTFNTGKGSSISGVVGQDIVVTMPSATDLVNDGKLYAGCVAISSWTDGTNDYELGQSYTLNSAATISAKYNHTQNISIAKALEICDEVDKTETKFNFTCVGEITSKSGDSTIISDGTNTITAYKISSSETLNIGDTIRVTGKLLKYKGSTPEFNSGCIGELVTDVQTIFQKEKTSTKLTASYTKTIENALGSTEYSHSFSNNEFTSNSQTKDLDGIEWTFDGDGAFFGGSGSEFQFGSKKNPYKNMTLTSVNSFSDVSMIKITTRGNSSIQANLSVTVGGTQIGETVSLTSSNKEFTFSSETLLTGAIELKYTQSSSVAMYIKNINIAYSDYIDQSIYTVTDAKIGFASLIKEKSYDENAKYGILVAPTDLLVSNIHALYASEDSLDDLISKLTKYSKYECTPVKCDATGKEDENGSYYQYGVIFTNSFENIDTSLTAVAYMELDGKVYLTSNEASYSLRTLAEAYLDSNVLADNEDANGVLNYIVNYGN